MRNYQFTGPGFEKPKLRPIIRAHVADAGVDAIRFECKCGWDSGWLINDMTITVAKRGIPCVICNTYRQG